MQQAKSRGFVTVATGSDHYYWLAANLLKSYKLFAKKPLPFALLCDRENEYTALFDDVIILEKPQRSYMDKVFLLNHILYDETLFVESDILLYKDITCFFDAFTGADSLSFFGNNYPVDADLTYGLAREKGKSWGWFNPQKMGKYQPQIQSIPQFGSGFVYLKKDLPNSAWDVCADIWQNAKDYGLKPIDDELFAVVMAIMGCNCVPTSRKYNQCVYPQMLSNGWLPDPNLHKGYCHFTRPTTGTPEEAHLCHWGSIFTKKALYEREVKILECRIAGNKLLENIWYFLYTIYIPLFNTWDSLISTIRRITKRVKHRLKRLRSS